MKQSIFEASEALQKWEGIILKKTRSFCWFSSNSEVEATWISFIGWPHKMSTKYLFWNKSVMHIAHRAWINDLWYYISGSNQHVLVCSQKQSWLLFQFLAYFCNMYPYQKYIEKWCQMSKDFLWYFATLETYRVVFNNGYLSPDFASNCFLNA